MQLSELRAWIDSHEEKIETTLRELVEINTATINEDGVDEGMDYLSQMAQNDGFTVSAINARHRLLQLCEGDSPKPRILLISHMDTVFPPDGDFLHYEPLADGFVRGPGTGDIKGGLLVGYWAMLALRELASEYDVQMIISADEEKGSPTIRDWYLNGHTGADYAIGLEPGFPQGDLTPDVPLGVVYQRRGYAAYRFTVKGKACHSGTPHLGVNAIEALAQRIIRLHQLGEPENGISVTVGMVEGGISPNTVSGEVSATVSWRYERMEDGQRIQQKVEEILTDTYVVNEELGLSDSVEMTLDVFLPPMERSDENQKLIDIVIGEAQRLGQNVVPIARGGGSDANHVSASGTPSICGMGVPAQGIHTDQEMIYLPGLYDRIELLASTLYRIAEGQALG